MVALPAFKFIFLAVRQLTRPVARQIVSRANTKKAVTYKVCVCLGRVSLGLTGVIAEWNQAEAAKKEAEAKAQAEEKLKKNAEEAAKAAAEVAKDVATEEANKAQNKASGTAGPSAPSSTPAQGNTASPSSPVSADAHPVASSPAAPAPAPVQPAPVKEEKEKEKEKGPTLNIVTPRSRPLLTELVYGPIPRPPEHEASCQNIHSKDTYDESVFYDKNKTVGDVARVFIRYPSRSAWDVFRRTFLSPFPEQRLVDAGADFLIELTAYFVLATLLCFELWQQYKSTSAKEAYLQARLTTIEEKVNELVQLSQEAADSEISALGPAPELPIGGRLRALWHIAESSAVTVGSLVTPFLFEDDTANKAGGAGGTAVPVRAPHTKKEGQIVPQVSLPKNAMEKPSKHDDTALMKRELELFLQANGMADTASPPPKRTKHEKEQPVKETKPSGK